MKGHTVQYYDISQFHDATHRVEIHIIFPLHYVPRVSHYLRVHVITHNV
jgi:hypothetical protein